MKKRLKDKLRRKKRLEHSSEAEISTDARGGNSNIAPATRAALPRMESDLHLTIDEFDDEEFLRLGKESFAYVLVETMVQVRDSFFSRMHHIPPEDEPYALLAELNRILKEGWRKLEEKWKRAEGLFPELAESLRDDPGNIKVKDGESPYLDEMVEIKQSMDEGWAFRGRVAVRLAVNPNDKEASAAIAELDEAFEVGKQRLSAATAKAYRQIIMDTDILINEAIEEATDEELILSVLETEAARRIKQYSAVLAQLEQALKNLLDGDEPQEIANLFERTVIENRKKLDAKRKAAEKRNPRLKKEYPMDENYNKSLTEMVEAIKIRDEMTADFKIILPENRAEALRLLQEMDKRLEREEQALANQYEAVQNQGRAVENVRFDVMLASPNELKTIRQYIKDNPVKAQDLQKIYAEEFPE